MIQDRNKDKMPQEHTSASKEVSPQGSGYAGYAQQAVTHFTQKKGGNKGTPGSRQEGHGASDAVVAAQPKESNAALVAASEIFGVSHLTQLKIVVEGTTIAHYKHFQLSQTATGHHSFSLVLDYDALGSPEDHQMEQAQKLMGKRILVTFSYKNITGGPERDFIGVITKVSYTREHGSHGNILLKGNSPTILLDAAPHIQSFGGTDPVPLSKIAKTLLEEGLGEKYPFRVAPGFTNNLTYSCQYDETHYNYLARTAEAYGEQFYYDGQQLHFGKLPAPEKALSLTFGKDVEEVEIEIRVRHVKRVMYGYNSSDHKPLTTGETKIEHTSSLAKAAYDISEKTFQTPSLRIAPQKAQSNQNIEAAQKSATGSEAVNVFVTSGRTSVPFLYPGCVVDMNMRKPGSADSSFLTRLMVTEISHSVDKMGNYTGYFEAIAEGTGYMPTPAFHMPVAEPQLATVTNNKDSQGRVQVKFDWQSGGTTSEWIRVIAPDAGGSDTVEKNRGHVFIPEVGDRCMVSFVHGHPDRPFVMGGLFHGLNGAGGMSDNHIKSIITRSGCTIQFDDTDGQGSITVHDPSGNSWYMDGKGNITLNAPKNIYINAGTDINMSAGANLNVKVGKDMNTNVGNDNTVTITKKHQFTADSYDQSIKAGKHIVVEGNLEVTTATTTHKTTKGDLLIQSSGVAKVLGKIDAKVNKG